MFLRPNNDAVLGLNVGDVIELCVGRVARCMLQLTAAAAAAGVSTD